MNFNLSTLFNSGRSGEVYEDNPDQTLENIYGVPITTDVTKVDQFLNAEKIDEYPIRNTAYITDDGETEYLVNIHILKNDRLARTFYIVEEPHLTPLELETYAQVRVAAKRRLPQIDRDDVDDESIMERILTDKLSASYSHIRLYNKAVNAVDTIIDDKNISKFEVSDFSDQSKQKILYYLKRDILGYRDVTPLMHDPYLEEINADQPNSPLFVNHDKYDSCVTNIALSNEDMESMINHMATKMEDSISSSSPAAGGSVGDGHRVQITTADGDTTRHGGNFTIRLFQEIPFSPIDLIEYDTVSVEQMSYLWLAAEKGRSMFVVGGTATGKTTMLNSLTLFLKPDSKIVTIEDTPELRIQEENKIQDITKDGVKDMNSAVADALRQRPETIIGGEVRTADETKKLIGAANTGHQLLTTFHADSFSEVVNRFLKMGIDKSLMATLDIVLVLDNDDELGKRLVKDIVEIGNYSSQEESIENKSSGPYNYQEDTQTLANTTNLSVVQEEYMKKSSIDKAEKTLTEREIVLTYLMEVLDPRPELDETDTEKLYQMYKTVTDTLSAYSAHETSETVPTKTIAKEAYELGVNPVIYAINNRNLKQYIKSNLEMDEESVELPIEMETFLEEQLE